MVDLVFVSLEGWDEIWRRNQFVVAELARRHPEMKVLFVVPAVDVSHAVRRGRVGELLGVLSGTRTAGSLREPLVRLGPSLRPSPRVLGEGVVEGLPNVVVTRGVKLLPNSWGWGRRVNEWLLRRHVRGMMRRLGMGKEGNKEMEDGRWEMGGSRAVGSLGEPVSRRGVVLWLNPHWAVHMVGRMGEAGVIYDITDDWISLTQADWLRELTAAQDAELCRKADAVIVCSERLFEMKRGIEWDGGWERGDRRWETGGGVEKQGEPSPRPSPRVPGEGEGGKLFLIPNGVDAEHYRRVLEGRGELPEVVRGWQRPVFGYTGTIHPDRVDVELVERLARAVGESVGGSVVLVGPNHLSESDRRRLEGAGNVHFVGPVAYREIPELMRGFDVCIVPHRMTDFTESLNPIKLWEYLAAGLPIVATDVAGFRDYPGLVRVARTREAFVELCAEAVGEGRSEIGDSRWEMGEGGPSCKRGGLGEARREEARRHSWGRRVDEIEGVIRGVAGGAPSNAVERDEHVGVLSQVE